jgi:hypothetical protein
MRTILGLGVVFFLVGCGGGSSGGGASAPTVHPFSDRDQQSAVGVVLPIGPFMLPEGATVTYDITDMPMGIGPDSMDCVVATTTELQRGQVPILGTGVRMGVSSTGATTPPLPADSYNLAIVCRNISDDCTFHASLSATFAD